MNELFIRYKKEVTSKFSKNPSKCGRIITRSFLHCKYVFPLKSLRDAFILWMFIAADVLLIYNDY